MQNDTEPDASSKSALKVRFKATPGEVSEAYIRLVGGLWASWLAEGIVVAAGSLILGATVPGAAFVVAAMFGLRLVGMWRVMRGEERHEHVAVFSLHGVTIISPGSKTHRKWTRFVRRSETARLHLFWVSRTGFIWIPKRVLSEVERSTLDQLAGVNPRLTARH